MNAQPKRLRSYAQERIVTVPLQAAGAGLRLLLKTGLFPVEIVGLRFVCTLDSHKDPDIRVVVSIGRNRGGFPCELASELRYALERSFCRFLIRARQGPSGTSPETWEWDSRTDILIRRRQRS
jgi:hypothetical protein